MTLSRRSFIQAVASVFAAAQVLRIAKPIDAVAIEQPKLKEEGSKETAEERTLCDGIYVEKRNTETGQTKWRVIIRERGRIVEEISETHAPSRDHDLLTAMAILSKMKTPTNNLAIVHIGTEAITRYVSKPIRYPNHRIT